MASGESIEELEAELQAARDKLGNLNEAPPTPVVAEETPSTSVENFEERLADLEARHKQELKDKDAAHAAEVGKLKAQLSLTSRQREAEAAEASEGLRGLCQSNRGVHGASELTMRTRVVAAKQFAIEVRWLNFAMQLQNRMTRCKVLGTGFR